jgi:hypothetical protein
MDHTVSSFEESSGVVIAGKSKRVHRPTVEMVDLHGDLPHLWDDQGDHVNLSFCAVCSSPLLQIVPDSPLMVTSLLTSRRWSAARIPMYNTFVKGPIETATQLKCVAPYCPGG